MRSIGMQTEYKCKPELMQVNIIIILVLSEWLLMVDCTYKTGISGDSFVGQRQSVTQAALGHDSADRSYFVLHSATFADCRSGFLIIMLLTFRYDWRRGNRPVVFYIIRWCCLGYWFWLAFFHLSGSSETHPIFNHIIRNHSITILAAKLFIYRNCVNPFTPQLSFLLLLWYRRRERYI